MTAARPGRARSTGPGIAAPGVQPDSGADEHSGPIGGRVESWAVLRPRHEDDWFEPTIVRGRD